MTDKIVEQIAFRVSDCLFASDDLEDVAESVWYLIAYQAPPRSTDLLLDISELGDVLQ